MPPSFSWEGPYIGATLGYGWGESKSFNREDDVPGSAFDGGNGLSNDPTGWLGGITLGYNWQFDAFVFGIEGDLGFLGAEDSRSNGFAFSETEYGGYGTITARLGFAYDRWLFYGKGGGAFADIENRAGDLDGGFIDQSDFTRLQEVRAGWALGGGVEFAFQRNMSMKIEYLYMDFGEDTSRNFDDDVFNHENTISTVKVGLNYSLEPDFVPLR
ncbi:MULTISPECIES: outer membrane beta-barrel protein [Rhodomicrobium]|uniref:outer membrane protein n=1 Tax=Rhodomicrobium TaxID=1068 RepID=UPI001483A8FD|nr:MULTISPECIES: outer membrane beta-barrel protein [Rhodomicrobium]